MEGVQDKKPCRRCKAEEATFQLRDFPTCGKCYVEYVDSKLRKRLGAVNHEIKISAYPASRRYIAGLSFGPSSSIVVRILDETAKYHASKKGATPFEPLAVHIDTDLAYPTTPDGTPAQRLLAKYRERFSHVSFECVHLSKVLQVKTIDWSALPVTEGSDDKERLRNFFDRLPSLTSKADILRLLIRHLLLDMALERSSSALLFGHTTTALASLTLSEVANGRGFSVPWQVNDGPYTVRTYEPSSTDTRTEPTKVTLPIYYPMREIFKGETSTYISLTPSLAELSPADNAASSSVVSHKDQSIEDVMTRYFESTEAAHSGIVANVVRITGKLNRVEGGESCRLCGMALDEQGDSRWAGDLGDERGESSEAGLCYGCRRSLK